MSTESTEGSEARSRQEHWERTYARVPPERLGWYEPHVATSLKWIRELHLSKDANIVDVGGGASALVDDLLDDGYQSVTVVDISKRALELARQRLGARAEWVTWINEDILVLPLQPRRFDLWHDRAAFHFLTTAEQQQRYRDQLMSGLRPGGQLIIAAFAPEAPPTCSGLQVERYTPDRLASLLGPEFDLERHQQELHVTPGGVEQMYLYCQFQRTC